MPMAGPLSLRGRRRRGAGGGGGAGGGASGGSGGGGGSGFGSGGSGGSVGSTGSGGTNSSGGSGVGVSNNAMSPRQAKVGSTSGKVYCSATISIKSSSVPPSVAAAITSATPAASL